MVCDTENILWSVPDNRIKEGIGEKRRSGPGASEILLAFTIPGDSYLSVI